MCICFILWSRIGVDAFSSFAASCHRLIMIKGRVTGRLRSRRVREEAVSMGALTLIFIVLSWNSGGTR